MGTNKDYLHKAVMETLHYDFSASVINKAPLLRAVLLGYDENTLRLRIAAVHVVLCLEGEELFGKCNCSQGAKNCQHLAAALIWLEREGPEPSRQGFFTGLNSECWVYCHAKKAPPNVTAAINAAFAKSQVLLQDGLALDPSPLDPKSAQKAILEDKLAALLEGTHGAAPQIKTADQLSPPAIPLLKRFASSLHSTARNLDNTFKTTVTGGGTHHLLIRCATDQVVLAMSFEPCLAYYCTCYAYVHGYGVCEHVQAALIYLDKHPEEIPPALLAGIQALPEKSNLTPGGTLFRLRARLNEAHLRPDALLPRLPVPPGRIPLRQRFAKDLAQPSGYGCSPTEGYLRAESVEPRRIEWRHEKATAIAQVIGPHLGLDCTCDHFAPPNSFCQHILLLLDAVDARSVKGQGVLAGEAEATQLRLGLKDWSWEKPLPPTPWQELGLNREEYVHIKKGSHALLREMDYAVARARPALKDIYSHSAQDSEDPGEPTEHFMLQLLGGTITVIEFKKSQMRPLHSRQLYRLLAADPALASAVAPFARDAKAFQYNTTMKLPLDDASAPCLLDALRLGKLHIGESPTPAKALPLQAYRLELHCAPVNRFLRLHLEESLGGKPVKFNTPSEISPWGIVIGQDFMPLDIGQAKIRCRGLLTKALKDNALLDGPSCRDLIAKLQLIGGMDACHLPPEWQLSSPLPPESCIIEIRPDKKTTLSVHPFFVYGELEVPINDEAIILANGRSRLFSEEIASLKKLSALGDVSLKKDKLSAPLKAMPAILAGAIKLGWSVRAEGKITRKGFMKGVKVKSGIDWLALDGGMDFDGQEVELVALIRALRRKEQYIILADGSRGWIDPDAGKRLARLAALGEVDKDAQELRFPGHQAFLLDALLHDMGEVSFDEAATKARDALKDFSKFEPMEPPKGFGGELRPYQKDGLGWLSLCRQLGLGACLADDMGLGKTVQLLAHLENLRLQKQGPFLVVCPASLLFNWEKEAKKFTPKMNVLVHQGTGRAKSLAGLNGFHLIVMTYATLRNDAAWLKDLEFSCIALDEAQAIKNATSASAKAARLLQGQQRLTLTGTPVENHLDDLWSLFEYLNPGLLGSSASFARFSETAGKEEGLMLMAKALRPLILRRTKAEVATDLPPLSQQILWCEMEDEQLAYYDKLLAAAKADLLENPGLEKKNSFLMLEKLLRLRQAACSPALCDKRKKPEDAPSAKLDAMMPMLEELLEEKHQVLIFSQFTEFLAIAAKRLETAKIPYAYLDGTTKDRGSAVDDFQQGGKNVFLISLKAGGTGLNLVAADYVFLLDPWWNPAVEQQAIDRAHRIGQSRPVTAYRLVAKGSIEEKILELQDKKRALADSLLGGEGLDLGSLQREDLEFLLG